MDLLLEYCEERGTFHWLTGMSQYLEGTFFQISLNFGYLLQAISVKTNSSDLESLLFTGCVWEVYTRKLLQ